MNVMEHPQFYNIIKQAWINVYKELPLQRVWTKLKNLKEKKWIIKVEKWSSIEEQVVRQKARAAWIENGDSNTKYFHAQ
ncbi:hypothetical protein RDI58_006058 [Solanum bulbocastanum]|uniref:Uncharacterized protein n=1 Tax=Solanum bulbocastanum TaxID=147425 RepID=A0AAN8YN80_SOLBU